MDRWVLPLRADEEERDAFFTSIAVVSDRTEELVDRFKAFAEADRQKNARTADFEPEAPAKADLAPAARIVTGDDVRGAWWPLKGLILALATDEMLEIETGDRDTSLARTGIALTLRDQAERFSALVEAAADKRPPAPVASAFYWERRS